MNDIQQIKSSKSLLESEAIIKSNESLVGMSVWNIGNELKTIRDTQSYKEKNYSSFEEYAENELRYSRRHTYRFIEIAENYSVTSMSQIANIGMTKLLSLAQVSEPEREEFIATQPIDEMTTRELREAIKAKKDLEKQVEELKSKPPKLEIREIEKVPSDYIEMKKKMEQLKRELLEKEHDLEVTRNEKSFLERKVKLNDSEARKYKELKEQIENLSKQKDDLGRQIKARTELSGLVVRIENILKTELAPIRYSRAISEASTDETVIRNLSEIVDRVSQWCQEMERYIPSKYNFVEIIDSEVIYND